MSYLGYVVAAYAVFIVVLLVDAAGSALRLRAARRVALLQQQRLDARRAATLTQATGELSR
ncbi:heme exporter protein CcmD [Stenotrophomonas sp. C3(2023)]|uniref:heme exporter protein CcmD n=1 Tax=Stenotrophomonas sp. C3(2023) TaxID=3080277 RepID=UPI00293C7AA7|nr:heme exporter protein CcmD [Stenotrophomonas sp. C3(2023)]MDV3468502.1 heme exporter protein CcmD [Stenotrophomonas sp. C3(2023)]